MDTLEKFVHDSTRVSAVLVDVSGKLQLCKLPLESEPDPDVLAKLSFAGVIGIRDGHLAFECAEPSSVVCRVQMLTATVRFANEILFPPKPAGDEIEFLQKLWSLSDPRKEN